MGTHCVHVNFNTANETLCARYVNFELDSPRCSSKNIVPSHLFGISHTNRSPYTLTANARMNPDFEFFYYDDRSARKKIGEWCGVDARRAYDCFAPPAYRADLFRFCALHKYGGVYLDADILLTKAIGQVVSMCSDVSMGLDFPQGTKFGKQMKILASRPRSLLTQCMVDHIIQNVKRRYYPSNPLALSGPLLLQKCYELEKNKERIAITYIDSRYARWPYTGMRTKDSILAYELPNPVRHLHSRRGSDEDYDKMFWMRQVYRRKCLL